MGALRLASEPLGDARRGLPDPGLERNSLLFGLSMHFFWMFLVWMVYSILAIGVLEAYSERNANLVRGAGAAMFIGGIIAVILSVVILWFGPVGPW